MDKNIDSLLQNFLNTRHQTEAICDTLEIEDCVVQPIPEVSPPKWHLAHSTWFFEQFILLRFSADYKEFHKDFSFLFNSYYNHIGERTFRHHRGFMTRPTLKKVYEYRDYVTQSIQKLFSREKSNEFYKLLEIGIHHEQQHQELLAYDIKYILGTQPTFPIAKQSLQLKNIEPKQEWIHIPSGVYQIGHQENSFCFDNEKPAHKVYVEDYCISNCLVSNQEYLEFIEDGGYQKFDFWLDEAWIFIQDNDLKCPLYWHKIKDKYYHYTFDGLKKLDLQKPVMHLSFYEAQAFANWKRMRLPTEFEWEIASNNFSWGQLWEWTYSAYLPYPGYSISEGALGEYNGKFMLNQMVLRGASIATPENHQRKTYRNFFHASSRWIFSGLRLVKK